MYRKFQSALLMAILLALPTSYAADTKQQGEKSMLLQSSAFAAQEKIPKRYTCDGENISPPLSWSNLPANTASLVLIVDDPDAPKKTWVHWILYNIPVSVSELPEAMQASTLPQGTLQGSNDWKKAGYGGPCPPFGSHRYFHKLYALDTVLPDLNEPNKANLEKAMTGHILASQELIATYTRKWF